jgi:hypothetical protein
MNNQSAVGYINANGEYRGTYVGFIEDPNVVFNTIIEITDGDQNRIEEWIEAGIAGGGYVSLDDDTTVRESGEDDAVAADMITHENYDAQNLDFVFVVKDGVPEFYDPKNVLGQNPDELRVFRIYTP